MRKKTTAAGWTARICCIAAILFVSMFALDSFEEGTLLQKLAAFGMHLIPSFVLALILLLAWKYELTGGIIFILIGIGMAPFIYNLNFERAQSIAICLQVLGMINLPFVVIGGLFIYSYYLLKKRGMAV